MRGEALQSESTEACSEAAVGTMTSWKSSTLPRDNGRPLPRCRPPDATTQALSTRKVSSWWEVLGLVGGVLSFLEVPLTISRRLSSVERFDPITEDWSVLSPLHTARCHHTCTVLLGKLYALGGRDADGRCRHVRVNHTDIIHVGPWTPWKCTRQLPASGHRALLSTLPVATTPPLRSTASSSL